MKPAPTTAEIIELSPDKLASAGLDHAESFAAFDAARETAELEFATAVEHVIATRAALSRRLRKAEAIRQRTKYPVNFTDCRTPSQLSERAAALYKLLGESPADIEAHTDEQLRMLLHQVASGRSS